MAWQHPPTLNPPYHACLMEQTHLNRSRCLHIGCTRINASRSLFIFFSFFVRNYSDRSLTHRVWTVGISLPFATYLTWHSLPLLLTAGYHFQNPSLWKTTITTSELATYVLKTTSFDEDIVLVFFISKSPIRVNICL